MGYSSLSNEKGKKNIDNRDGYTNARRLINTSTKICLTRSLIRGNFNATLVAHPFRTLGTEAAQKNWEVAPLAFNYTLIYYHDNIMFFRQICYGYDIT